jgi:ABC-type glycerol-3-phosphate transport system substrate-binding protein
MPLVFESYSSITYLAESAPELAGLWGVAPMPGTIDSTGKLNRTEGSSGLSACSIVVNNNVSEEVRKQKEANSWEFLKWWTSADVMAEYGNRIEMAIGPVARYTTANLEAFELLNWTTEEANAIKAQREWVKEIPELVGGYYVSRSIVNAFRNVTNNYTNPREMLFFYNDQINAEIWRKRMEYDLYVPEGGK